MGVASAHRRRDRRRAIVARHQIVGVGPAGLRLETPQPGLDLRPVFGLETGLVNILRRLPRERFAHRVLCMKTLGPNAARVEEAGASVVQVGTCEQIEEPRRKA